VTAPVRLLDTGSVVVLLHGRPPTVEERVRREKAAGAVLAISTVVLFEPWDGVARSRRPDYNADRLRDFLAGGIEVLPLTEEDAIAAADARAALAAAGTPIGPYDVLIAGQALRRGVILVTTNVGGFSRVEGLRWEDWSGPT